LQIYRLGRRRGEMSNRMVVFGIVIALFMLAILFIPVIFGSMEPDINLTNNTTKAVYQTVSPFVITSQFLFWVGAIVAGLLLVAGILFFRR
jgi:hypothetical protein